MDTVKNEIVYSVVIPVYNEEVILPEIIMRTEQVLVKLKAPYEIILVNDGSADRTWEIISENHRRNPAVKGIKFSRNFGHQVAIIAGLRMSKGKIAAVMDADGQDPPELFPEFFKKCEEGFDIVYAVRKKRKGNFLKKIAYFTFYRMLNKMAAFEIPLDTGDFSVLNRKTVNLLVSFKEHNPFIRGLRCWGGGKSIGIEYNRPDREKGEPKYGIMKLVKLAMSGFISFSKVPLRISIVTGITISIISFGFGFINIFRYIIFETPFSGFATIVVIISFLGGIQLIMLGMIGEYIGSIFDEIKQRPVYVIDEFIGLDKSAAGTPCQESIYGYR
jgi:polyisoprenyl-phosphate glycosyltransferase